MAIKFKTETREDRKIRAIPVVAKNAQTAPSPSRKGKGGRPAKADKLVAVTIRLHPDVLARMQAKGPRWRSIAAGLIGDGL